MICLCYCHVCLSLCRNELLGLEGMVTQKNPDENVNHLPSATPRCIVDGTVLASGENVDANKRFIFALQLFICCIALLLCCMLSKVLVMLYFTDKYIILVSSVRNRRVRILSKMLLIVF